MPESEPLASSPPLQGETVTFTGILASMTHEEAARLAESLGATCSHHVTRQTSLLVIGEEGWPLDENGRPSQKVQHVQDLQESGLTIRILNEAEWLYLVGLTDSREGVQRIYTPAMLSKLLDIPVNVIRAWERAGLIRPIHRVQRLPYFDFQEVTSARRLSQLIGRGIEADEIATNLEALKNLVGDIDRPLAQLDLLSQNQQIVIRDAHGLIHPASRQRLFDFGMEESLQTGDSKDDSPVSLPFRLETESVSVPMSADDWIREAGRRAEAGELQNAIEALRQSLKDLPGDPEVNFQLADLLYRCGESEAARERFYMTVEFDPFFVEAWTQLGCVLLETGNRGEAFQAFETAVEIHEEYGEAHWHLAEMLYQNGDSEAALPHWQKYLTVDSVGPWANEARHRISEAHAGTE